MSFEHFLCTILFLETSPMKFHRVTKLLVKFVGDATFKLSFNFKTCFYKQ
jgi:hypothetical protein